MPTRDSCRTISRPSERSNPSKSSTTETPINPVDSPSWFSPTRNPWPKLCVMTVTPSPMARPSTPGSQRRDEGVAAAVAGVTEVEVVAGMVAAVDMVEGDPEATAEVVVDMAVDAVVEDTIVVTKSLLSRRCPNQEEEEHRSCRRIRLDALSVDT